MASKYEISRMKKYEKNICRKQKEYKDMMRLIKDNDVRAYYRGCYETLETHKKVMILMRKSFER